MENVPLKVIGSQLTANEFNDGLMTEAKNAVTSTGQILTSADLNQLSKSMANYSTAATYFLDSGIANSYIVNTLNPLQGPTQYFNGMTVHTLPNITNTGGPATINVNSLGVKNIKTRYGIDPSRFDIFAGRPLQLQYNGTNFIIVSELAGASGLFNLGGEQAIPENVQTLVAWVAETDNQNIDFDTINHLLIPRVRGIYSVSVQVSMRDISNASFKCTAEKNGPSGFVIGQTQADTTFVGETILNADGLVSMNGTSDNIKSFITHTDNAPRGLTGASHLTIALVRRT